MQLGESQESVLRQLAAWGEGQPLVRAMILTSTRAVPGARVDILSDYDVILMLSDARPFFEESAWLNDFGPVLAFYRDPVLNPEVPQESGYVVQYEDGFKLDFTICPLEVWRKAAARPQLPDELDAGYQVILDKDHLTDDLKAPTYKAYIPTPPTQQVYLKAIELFFLDTAYVAKFLWRDDLVAAKHLLETFIRHEHLMPMLEWHAQIDHGWSLKPGPYGRGLKRRLRPDLWTELESTYTGLDVEANWTALYAIIGLMRRVMVELGEHLSYTYPHDLDTRAMNYLHKLRHLLPNADPHQGAG